MGTWNHRITRRSVPVLPGSEETQFFYEIREVHYDDEGKVVGWTEDPVAVTGETIVELLDYHAIMGRVAGHPVLDIDTREDIPFRDEWRRRPAR